MGPKTSPGASENMITTMSAELHTSITGHVTRNKLDPLFNFYPDSDLLGYFHPEPPNH